MIKKTVGRRFFKYEIPEGEFLKIKAGRPLLPGEISNQEYFDTEWFTEKWIKGLKKDLNDFLISVGITPEPIVYRRKLSESDPDPWPTEEDFRLEDYLLKGLALPDYILFLGYDHDSLEHLAAHMFYLVFLLEAEKINEPQSSREDFLNKALFLSFEIGRSYALFVTYQTLGKDNSRGGKNKINPWREYGKQLREQYPDMPQVQIWSKIFRTAARKKKEEERELEKENKTPAFPITEISVFESEDFEIYADLTTKKLRAVFTDFKGLVKDTRETAFNNFRRYLNPY